MKNEIKTLNQFIVERQADFPYATGELSRLLSDIGAATKIINREVSKAGLVNILGITGDSNVHGEEVKKLDIYANEQLISALTYSKECTVLASEENEDLIYLDNNFADDAKYVIAFDPLDGSSNIDVNAPIGTIFTIFRRITKTGTKAQMEDCLQKGTEQVAAGYVIYGSSTMMVYTTGHGVNGFTLDPSIGEYCLSHPKMRIPENGHYYSTNEGYFNDYSEGIRRYIEKCRSNDNPSGKACKARYIGSLIADIHRTLLKGGIFLYPPTAKNPGGKLRLVYEGNPMAFIVEQAGGKATDGKTRILDIKPEKLHQRVPLITGDKHMVDEVGAYIRKYDELPKLA